MISVLSIMGLLSTLAFFAFRAASTKLAVNTLLEEVRKQAVTTATSSSKHMIHPLAEGLFDTEASTSAPRVVLNYSIGDHQERSGFKVSIGNRTYNNVKYRIAYVPIGKFGNYGQSVSKEICQQLVSLFPPTNRTPQVGEVITLKNANNEYITTSNAKTKCGQAASLNVLWIGVRIR